MRVETRTAGWDLNNLKITGRDRAPEPTCVNMAGHAALTFFSHRRRQS